MRSTVPSITAPTSISAMREPLSVQAARTSRAPGGQCAGIVPARQCGVGSGSMEFTDVVRRRRMVRRFEQRPVPADVMDRILEAGRRAPSAGFSQGLELLVLDTPETIAEFWDITRDPAFPWEDDEIAAGPTVIVVPLPDKARYIE